MNTDAESGPVSAKAAHPLAETVAPMRSEFVVPHSSSEGRDPFFPNSDKFKPPVSVSPTPFLTTLTLKAISGTQERPLAIINDRTFSEGETADVRTAGGRVSVTCISINGLKVIIKVGSETRELWMRDGTLTSTLDQ